ncbi:TPA: hypothetical protein OT171_004753 [Citrobacter sedlakii]|nr:hypothetical protein [Citrobacter sedlakii]
MKMTNLSLLAGSIIIHFLSVKGYVFKVLNQYAYDYLEIFYVSSIIFGFVFLLKKTFLVDLLFCIAIPYISSMISFFCVSIQASPHVIMKDLWSSIIIGVSLPYIALYAWFLSAILIVGRIIIYCVRKSIKNI